MLTKIPHRMAANPWIYDQVQLLAGARYVHRRLAAQIAPPNSASLVLDLGGGTGMVRGLWPPTCTYVCLDIDMLKLQGFLNRHPDGIALVADAARTPLESGSVDVVLCTFLSHHIPDELLTQLISESMRVLKNTGKFIFIDAIWEPTRWAGRLLWKYDRGSYPRTAETLYSAISNHCAIIHWEHFAVYHEYVLCVATK